jgi:phosphate butyryltransferase
MEKIRDIYEMLKNKKRKILAVAAAEDPEVLTAVAAARKAGIIQAKLYGDREKIVCSLNEIGESTEDYIIYHCENVIQAVQTATVAVSGGDADILMKGLMSSSDFLRAVLNKEFGLRLPNSTLSAVAVFELEIEGRKRLLFLTDPGFIPLPDLNTKVMMIKNVVEQLNKIGYEIPKIAVLSAMETVNPKIISSVEAKQLEEMNSRGEIENCIVGGPFSMDLALSEKSAKHKGFNHPVAGKADVLLVPSLEVGNAVLKTISYLVGCPQAGFVCGTSKPVVFTSRSDSADTKLNTIAFAALMAN